MRLFLICDNEDTATGMRLAGIESIITNDKSAVVSKLNEISDDSRTGIILINQTLSRLCSDEISEFRKNHSVPLIVEIPDRNSDGSENSIAEYVRNSIGIQV
ncbi:MAG: V-type ATP synthase subunit F [Clostridia bacterium]|nr:V-type ATP synthase subunit F [Clostridia bacterium]